MSLVLNSSVYYLKSSYAFHGRCSLKFRSVYKYCKLYTVENPNESFFCQSWLLRPAPMFYKNPRRTGKKKRDPKETRKYIKRKSVVTFSCASKVQFNKICNVHTRKMTDSDHSAVTPPHSSYLPLSAPTKCHSDLSH